MNLNECPVCKRPVVKLFLSTACDYCDYGPDRSTLHQGFVVLTQRPLSVQKGVEEYVFRTHADGERWREAAGRTDAEIVKVLSLTPYRWHLSRGTLRDVVLADHMFEIFADHRFEPLPHRAFIDPQS